jgi:hypothetical protein
LCWILFTIVVCAWFDWLWVATFKHFQTVIIVYGRCFLSKT